MPVSCAIRTDLSILAGSSKTYRLTIYDELGVLLDLTGSTLYFTVKTQAGVLQFQRVSTDTAQIEILPQTGATLGQADVKLVPSNTASMPAAEYKYDAWIVLVSGKRYAIIPPSIFRVEIPVTVIP
jgi:hypothetical protein